MRERRGRLTLLGALAVLVMVIIVSCAIGAVRVPPGEVVRIVAGSLHLPFVSPDAGVEETHRTIIRDIRLPRVVMGALVGMALALAGAALQGLFKNPMADPYILGVSSGASLGAVIALAFSGHFRLLGLGPVPMFAFGGGLLAMFLVYRIALIGHRIPLSGLLLAGVAVGTFFLSGVSLVIFFAGDKAAGMVFWMMGHLGSATWQKVQWAIPYLAVGAAMIAWYSRDLNAMLLGEETAGYLGVEVETVKRAMLIAGAMLVAGAVAFCGAIGFVGLIVPHVVRFLVGPDHKWLLPASALAGGALLVGADTLARSLLTTTELPVGVIMGALGGPFFLFLLRRQMLRA